ncbi:ComF family protein [Sedimenticola hydrogenitrophicus]|uniref:ComF family protein n=1 Tax=Sedimenticola hydrogenitrophicus TaxID=2967975 RepID=UPI0021A467BE
MVYSCINNILSLLYPDHCRLCDAPARAGLCAGCREELPYNAQGCRRCGLPLTLGRELVCGHCLQHPPAVDRSLIPFLYAAPIDRLIGQFKFSGRLAQGRLLSRLLGDHLERQATLPELLIPVPLHPSRLRQRGYNQALELARPLGRRFAIPLDHQSCSRIRHTRPQHALNKHQRRQNIRGAFQVSQPITARHVALVDDVVTTSNTVNELARQLKRAGVARVDVWAVARTP